MKTTASTESTTNPKRNNFRWVKDMIHHLIDLFMRHKRLMTYKVLDFDAASSYRKLRMTMENIYENEHSNYILCVSNL